MRQFKIYHATGTNRFQEVEKQPRVLAGTIEADSLQGAFVKTQNFNESWNKENPCRSTSVGDVIESDEGYFMVCGLGFKPVNEW